MPWKMLVEEECMKVELSKEDAPCQSRWIVGVNVYKFFYCLSVYLTQYFSAPRRPTLVSEVQNESS